MKIKILLIFMLFISANLQAQTTFETIISDLFGLSGSFKNIGTTVVEVNSTSKMGGITRQAIAVSLPTGTTKWYYRVTVMPITMDYSYQSNETFYYLLQNKKTMKSPTLAPDDNINFYLIDQSSYKTLFLAEKGFSYHGDGSYKNINSFVAQSTYIPDNLWIGIENPNLMHGLKVIVEIAAWGNYK